MRRLFSRAATTLVTAIIAVSTAWADVPVKYIDEKGIEQECTDYIIVDEHFEEFEAGWYVVTSEVNYNHYVVINGNVHLILADNCNMTINTNEDEAISLNGDLIIYGQSGGTGKLTANGATTGINAYDRYSLTINGGTVTTSGVNSSITSYDVTINGGVFNATSEGYGIYASGNVIINGGVFNATSESYGIYASGNVIINGGNVKATGDIGIYANGNITLGWTNYTDRITATSYQGTVAIASGKNFIDEYGNLHNAANVGKIDNVTLRAAPTVAFLDKNGEPDSAPAIVLFGTEDELTAGTYFVGADITYDHTLTIYGNVTLILCDGATMNVGTSEGRIGGVGILTTSTLTIYGQSLGSGKLKVYTTNIGSNAIRTYALSVNDISVIADTNGDNGTAIYAEEELTINRSTITATATATKTEGIWCNDTFTINGGTVNASGTKYGIGVFSNLTINGGTVTANAPNGDGIFTVVGTITLGWTNATDRIYASSYASNYYGTVTIASGKAFVTDDATPSVVRGTLAASSITGKALSPCLQLADNADNGATIGGFSGKAIAVQLQGRTLWKDGKWNTLCLPFDVDDFTGTPLENAVVKALISSSFESGTLTMNFTEDKDNLTRIEAGKPYIVKWTAPDPYVAYDGSNAGECSDIVAPTFLGVTVSNASANVETEYVDFIGTYSPIVWETENHSVLFLGGNSTLYYPQSGISINACRAYFELKGIEAGNITTARLFFGDSEDTGIRPTPNPSQNGGEWYDLSGRKLVGKPTKAGLYIYNGIKVAIK